MSLSRIPKDLYDLSYAGKGQATSEHGLALFWSFDKSQSVQGVTNLTKQERCQDPWYGEVLDECRIMKLSQTSWRFIHGYPTKVPGSWRQSAHDTCSVACGSAQCQLLAEKGTATHFPDAVANSTARCQTCSQHVAVGTLACEECIFGTTVMALECSVCGVDRNSRKLVATDASEPRFQHDKFVTAPLIVPNNDVKYHTNLRRALEFAKKHTKRITWAQAKDSPGAEALKSVPISADTKMQWLRRHDRESGDLYGMLPLVEGMPVALTGHLDRSHEKCLLKGSRGIIAGWELAQDEASSPGSEDRFLTKVPQAVLVKFDNAAWQLPGMMEAGVYPVRPVKGDWWLDKNRPAHVLKVKRHQIPLAPAFGKTAHGAQGATEPAAIVDLNTPRGANPLTSYVALSRVRRREDMLIFRPFPIAKLQGGAPPGPQLLLDKLAGKFIDWAAVQKQLAPDTRRCSSCKKTGAVDDFSTQQWCELSSKRLCRECERLRPCQSCEEKLEIYRFSDAQWGAPAAQRRCLQCESGGGPCGVCGQR